MSKNLALTLARAKNNGIREGIDAVCEAMALAHYNAAIELELDEREVGARGVSFVEQNCISRLRSMQDPCLHL